MLSAGGVGPGFLWKESAMIAAAAAKKRMNRERSSAVGLGRIGIGGSTRPAVKCSTEGDEGGDEFLVAG